MMMRSEVVVRSEMVMVTGSEMVMMMVVGMGGWTEMVTLFARNVNSGDLWTSSLFIAIQEKYIDHCGRVIKNCLFYNYSMFKLRRQWPGLHYEARHCRKAFQSFAQDENLLKVLVACFCYQSFSLLKLRFSMKKVVLLAKFRKRMQV
ncbi:hypothetical protein LguiB_032338 [Lonicera macranthoides]